MKKVLLAAVAVIAIAPAAHAQDKTARTFNQQPATTTTTTTTAAPAPSYSSDTTTSSTTWGPYVGVYGGYGWTDADTNTAAGDFDVNGADYGGLVGFKVDSLLQNMGVGMTGAVEGYYGGSSADDTNGGIKLEKGDEWGVNFRPGLSFLSMGGSINPYGILGYRRTEYKVTGAGSDHFNGFDLGIGTELVAWNNIGLRADYTHTFYADKGGIDPDENDVRAALVYHFQ